MKRSLLNTESSNRNRNDMSEPGHVAIYKRQPKANTRFLAPGRWAGLGHPYSNQSQAIYKLQDTSYLPPLNNWALKNRSAMLSSTCCPPFHRDDKEMSCSARLRRPRKRPLVLSPNHLRCPPQPTAIPTKPIDFRSTPSHVPWPHYP